MNGFQYKLEIFSPANNSLLAVVHTSDAPFAYGFSFSVQTRVVITDLTVTEGKRVLEVAGEAMPQAKRKFLTDFFGVNPLKQG